MNFHSENQYHNLALANVSALFYDKEYRRRFEVLNKLSEEFKKANVEWAAACSFALFLRGIVDNFHDFDIMVAPSSFDAACEALTRLGSRKTEDKDPSRAGCFASKFFAEFEVDGIDIDVICEFGITTFGSVYQYHFNVEELQFVNTKQLGMPDELEIPVIATEIQYVLYALMVGWQPQRAFKRDIIAKYLKSGNMDQPALLRNILQEGAIPAWLTVWIRQLLMTT